MNQSPSISFARYNIDFPLHEVGSLFTHQIKWSRYLQCGVYLSVSVGFEHRFRFDRIFKDYISCPALLGKCRWSLPRNSKPDLRSLGILCRWLIAQPTPISVLKKSAPISDYPSATFRPRRFARSASEPRLWPSGRNVEQNDVITIAQRSCQTNCIEVEVKWGDSC